MNIKKIREFKNTVSYFKLSKNNILVVDKENRVYLFDLEFNLIRGFKINIPVNNPDENCIKADSGLKYLLLTVKKHPLMLFDIEKKKILKKFKWHTGDVLSVAFDLKGNYFASGGIDGKVYLYSLSVLKMVSRILKYKDFISDIAFDDNIICAGSFDKSNIFVPLDSLKKKIRKLHLKKVRKIEKNIHLISASEYTDIISWNGQLFDSGDRINIYSRFKDFFEYEKYLFIAVENKIVLYDTEKKVLINDSFLNVKCSRISVFNDILYFSAGNAIYRVDLIDEKELIDIILKGDYKTAYRKVMLNPFLKKTRSFQKLEKLYKASLKKAVKLFEEGMKSQAVSVLQPFMTIMEKREEINKIINAYENIIKLKKAFEKKNYSLLYHIAEQYEILKNTKYYRIVEKEWEINFQKAEKLALEGKIYEVKEILKNFISVKSKLPLINLLLEKSSLFRILQEKSAKKDYKGFFAVVKEHPELKHSREYKNLMEYAHTLYLKALKTFENENFNELLKICAELEEIEGYEDKAKELIKKANIALLFLKLFNENKNKAFELAEKYTFLKNLKVYRIYEERWKEKLLKAEEAAFNGKINKSLKVLKEYEKIDKKKNRIKNMLKSAYLNYIMDRKDKKAVAKYIKVFGKDEELVNVLKTTKIH